MKRSILVTLLFSGIAAFAIAGSFYVDLSPTGGSGIDTVFARNIDTISKLSAHIPITDVDRKNLLYSKMTYQFIFPQAIAGAAGTPGGLGNVDSGKVILEGITPMGTVIKIRTDSAVIPCTLTVSNVGPDSTLAMYDALRFRMYCMDSTGSLDTIKWYVRWTARMIK